MCARSDRRLYTPHDLLINKKKKKKPNCFSGAREILEKGRLRCQRDTDSRLKRAVGCTYVPLYLHFAILEVDGVTLHIGACSRERKSFQAYQPPKRDLNVTAFENVMYAVSDTGHSRPSSSGDPVSLFHATIGTGITRRGILPALREIRGDLPVVSPLSAKRKEHCSENEQ